LFSCELNNDSLFHYVICENNPGSKANTSFFKKFPQENNELLGGVLPRCSVGYSAEKTT